MVAPQSIFYILYFVLFHKYVGESFAVTNCMSPFFMFVRTKSVVKVANGNTVRAQVIGIILCRLTNCSIIYPVVPVYYFPCHPYDIISLGDLKFYPGFQRVTYERHGKEACQRE